MIHRREFFRLAGVSGAGASAMFLAACGNGGDAGAARSGTGTGSEEADVAVLNSALDLENLAVAAYTAGAALLEGDAKVMGARFRDQEQEHADGLAQAIRDLGGTPNKPRHAEEYAPMFKDLKSQRDVLRFAVDLENTAVAAYIDALPKLSSGELRGTAAAIVTTEAEHVSVLRGALGQDPLAAALVTGQLKR